jgi:hypothetical protein
MPMLHGCGFPGCTTLTLSAYCVEHELLARALKESERAHADLDADPSDELSLLDVVDAEARKSAAR